MPLERPLTAKRDGRQNFKPSRISPPRSTQRGKKYLSGRVMPPTAGGTLGPDLRGIVAISDHFHPDEIKRFRHFAAHGLIPTGGVNRLLKQRRPVRGDHLRYVRARRQAGNRQQRTRANNRDLATPGQHVSLNGLAEVACVVALVKLDALAQNAEAHLR